MVKNKHFRGINGLNSFWVRQYPVQREENLSQVFSRMGHTEVTPHQCPGIAFHLFIAWDELELCHFYPSGILWCSGFPRVLSRAFIHQYGWLMHYATKSSKGGIFFIPSSFSSFFSLEFFIHIKARSQSRSPHFSTSSKHEASYVFRLMFLPALFGFLFAGWAASAKWKVHTICYPCEIASSEKSFITLSLLDRW